MPLMIANNSMRTSNPILSPPEKYLPKVPQDYPFDGLTAEQRAKMSQFRVTHLPGVFAALTGAPCDNEEAFVDDVRLLKYLRATKWDLPLAVKRLQETMQWRREIRPTEFNTDDPAARALNSVGCIYLDGFDKLCRPILVVLGRLASHFHDHDVSIRLCLHTLEKGFKLMPPSVTQLSVICDYSRVTMFNGFPLSFASRFLTILAKYYPEDLGMI
ncbi:hypothetical protein HDU84_004206, partial [Entophlyctis sp. JEL0112]